MTHEERKFYINLGICPVCTKNNLFGDEKSCLECRASNTNQKLIKYETDSNYRKEFIKSVVESKKERRKRRREQGLCIECGKNPPKIGIATCDRCRAKSNARKRMKYEQATTRESWIKNGLCCLCGEKCEEGYKVCEKHHKMYIDNAQTQRAKRNRDNQKKQGLLTAYHK